MALILAVNPGASQSATLARLARELQNCELIGADSYNVAIKAIDQRPPDLILLPGTDALGEAELLRRLRAVPRVVPTLKLPPAAGLDVKALAADVRSLLGEPVRSPAPAGTSPNLLAAAAAAVRWVHSRRARWQDVSPEETASPRPHAPAFGPAESSVPGEDQLVARLREAALDIERERERQRELEAQEPSALERAAEAASELGETVTNWVPLLAATAALLATVAGGIIYWPTIRDASSAMLASFTTPGPPREREAPPVSASSPSQRPAALVPAADSDNRVSGWIAVFAPFEISLSEGNESLPVDDQGRAMLSPGSHRLRFRNQELGYDEVRAVQIRPTETTTLNLLPRTTLGVTSNEPAEVLVDGTTVGHTPVERHRIGLGTHTVVVRSSGAERRFTVDATMKPIQLDVDFLKP
jgi:PEGA domain